MQTPYPVALNLAGRRVVVVGGGPVAARRVRGVLSAAGHVTVVAPGLCEDLAQLVAAEQIHWTPRAYEAGDLIGAWLAHTATGVAVVDAAVAAEAEERGTWCIRADDAGKSSAWTTAVARVDDIVVGVSAGADPRRAAALRDGIQAGLDSGSLPTRRRRQRRTGITAADTAGRVGAAGTDGGSPEQPAGRVALVGGGPGDPGLITSRGRRLLAAADVVVVDRLAPRSLLAELTDDVLIIDVGKTPSNHPVTQDEICRILVEQAKAGRRVVRLKGGDPYVLGRGGEELAACQQAGVQVEVVPGVTSAIAVPAAVGIPVTHRGLSKQVTVLSGHEPLDDHTAAVGGTLVLLMGMSLLADTATRLQAAGRDSMTPAAIIEDGYGPRQRLTLGRLADIAERANAVGARAPAVIVIGEVVTLAPAWPPAPFDPAQQTDPAPQTNPLGFPSVSHPPQGLAT